MPLSSILRDINTPLSYSFMGGVVASSATLARSSSGVYYNTSGVLSSASSNVARFDNNPSTLAKKGLLIEPATTNLQVYSNGAFNTQWENNGATISDASATSPDSTQDATAMVMNSGAGGVYLFFYTSIGQTYTQSAYVKYVSGDGSAFRFGCDTNTTDCYFQTDISTMTFGYIGPGVVAYSIDAINNNWYRFLCTWVATDTSSSSILFNVGASSLTTNIYGFQCENQTTKTSLVQTGASTASRSADQLSFTIPVGVGHLVYTFDDNSTQTVAVSPGAYTVPTNLNRPWIKTIVGII